MSSASGQLQLALGPFENRALFSRHFLDQRLVDWPEFADLDAGQLLADLTELWEAERDGLASANEAQTEARLIQPVLHMLEFSYTVQAGLRMGVGRRQPDYALFLSDEARRRADLAGGAERYREAVAVADAKRFGRPLDRGRGGGQSDDPVAQIINYVAITGCRWGVLTNGRLWRLYAAEGDLVEAASFEIDLVALIEHGDPSAFRWFAAFFSARAFAPGESGLCFLDRVLTESDANAVEVGRTLEEQVFAAVPLIAQGLLGDDERMSEGLAAAFDNSLVLLYRLLFCLHAEARGLLPVENPHYVEYSVRRQRERVARDRDRRRVFSARSDDLYNDLRALFRMIDAGDPALGVSEYDGGLFSAGGHPYFENRFVPDDLLSQALDKLYRIDGQSVDYRDLSIRHLGTIYERLLEYRLEDAGSLGLRLALSDGRHRSGSYFTPDFVVDRIVQRTLDPLLSDRSARVASEGLRGHAALDALLEIRVCDPAMGSGHFIVAAAAWIAQSVVTDPSYDGDLSLVDVQRLVAERCVYGVDLNPMAVELARLSLWLATVREGEPLAFLHNLRCGNSLVGASVDDLLGGRDTVFADRLARDADALLAQATAIGSVASHTGADVDEKEALASAASALRAPLEELASATISPALIDEAGSPFHWELEFPEVFLGADGRPTDGGGFDAIVGNPPYVRIQELGRRLADYCRARYSTARGSFDTYIPFIERGVELLAAEGRLGFIVPNKFMKLDSAAGLRRMLTADRIVEEVLDFGDSQLFEGATNYTAILLLSHAGADAFRYRRITGDRSTVRRALGDAVRAPGERYPSSSLGASPWLLAVGEARLLIDRLRSGAERLDAETAQIFQGLITGADSIYIFEDRGWRGTNRLVRSRASGEPIELESPLLHPLASGADVHRYAFRPTDQLLLFPYRRGADAEMRLMAWDQVEEFPAVAAYLSDHEATLRARERGRMDHDGWYAFSRTQNLGLHDKAKLGVPRMCAALRASIDPSGTVYLDNVDVNGVLGAEGGPSLWTLLVLLNSDALNFVFSRSSVPFRGRFLSANRQFIAPLPIRSPDAGGAHELDSLGERLHATAEAIGTERRAFLAWVSDLVGARIRDLSGSTQIANYEQQTVADIVTVLMRNSARLRIDPASRDVDDALSAAHRESRAKLGELALALARDRREAERRVADLYELTSVQRALIAEDAPGGR